MESSMKGLLTYVLRRDGQDCSLNGLTSRKTQLILVDEDEIIGPFSPGANEDYLVLTRKNHPTFPPVAVPKSILDSGTTMHCFGGNFIYTSDGRFPSKQPIAVHDRVESQELSDLLSR